jgi:hypothetical protein
MGLIKTAIMSGAAMYSVNKISKAAQNHSSNNKNNNNSSSGNCGGGGALPASYQQQYYPRDDNYPRGPSRQVLDRGPTPPRYSDQEDYYDLPQSHRTPRQSGRPITQTAGYDNNNNNNSGYGQQRGHMEPGEVVEEPRGFRSTAGMTEMLDMLSQQVPGMSAMVQGQSGRAKGSKLGRIFEN